MDEKPTQSIQECDFSCEEEYCKLLNKAGVPHDEKWRTLILYMRNITHHNYLTTAQKKLIQKNLFQILKERSWSEIDFKKTLSINKNILFAPFKKKLEDTAQETAKFFDEFKGLILRRKTDVQNLEVFTVENIQNNKEPEELIAKLRMAFRKVTTAMEEDAEQLKQMSITDVLTGIHNRRALDDFLAQSLPETIKENKPYSFLLLDVDHFKKFNDTYGHRIGDQALSLVGSVLKNHSEQFESEHETDCFAARYGGEEFSLALPSCSLEKSAAEAEIIRKKIEAYDFIIRDSDGKISHKNISITVSIGAACLLPQNKDQSVGNLIENADKALYTAKSKGRNQVCTEPG